MNVLARFHLIILVFSITTLASANEIMKPGAWENVMVVEADHPKTGQRVVVNETRTTLCLTEKFLKTDPYLNAGIDEEKMHQRHANCMIVDFTRGDLSASWTMSCTMADGKEVNSNFEVTVAELRTTTRIRQSMEQDGKTIRLDSLVESNYVSECTDEMPRP